MERLPGFRDFYPEPVPTSDSWSCEARQRLFESWRALARRYGFREYDGPPLEPLELYTNKSGAEIVGQLFNFVDKGSRAVALRPEMTLTAARMIAATERHYKKPVKWFAIPQLFRYEKQQKGRTREHFQLNCDIFGEKDLAADAEIVALLIDCLRATGLTESDFVVRLSSRLAWQDFFAARIKEPDRAYEFYQAVDKLEREPAHVSEQSLSDLGIRYEDVLKFIQAAQPTPDLQAVVDNLNARDLGGYVKVDYNVVRGLAYYTGIVFEAFDRKGEFRAIAGGGRYDHLVREVSGGSVDLPALGFGMGDVVLLELLKTRHLLPKNTARIDIVVLVEDESLRIDSLKLIQQLRNAGRSVDYSLTPAKSDKQFKRALDLNASWTVRLERDSVGGLAARVRNLEMRTDARMGVAEVIPHLQP
jgi:histidyl-tRNA synthetase